MSRLPEARPLAHAHGHRGHMALCLVAAVALLGLAIAGRLSAPVALGFGLAMLVCPLAIGAAVWVLLRDRNRPGSSS